MDVRLIPLTEVTDDDAVAWRGLADDAVEPNVYLDPRFLIPARDRGDADGDLRVVVVEEDGRWLALLAVTTKPLADGVPFRAATTGGTFMTPHSDRHHPLVRRGRAADALEALLRGMTAAGLPGLLQLQRFPQDGPLADALAEVVARTPMRVHERRCETTAYARRPSVVVAPAGGPATGPVGAADAPAAPGDRPAPVVRPPLAMDHMGTDERRNMRRGVRGLERETGGPLELHDLSADSGVDEEFLDLQAAGWKGDAARGGAALRLDPVGERWFRTVTAAFRADGDLLAVRLAAGGQTLWIGYALRSGGTYFGFLDAYAEAHRRYSPGSIGRVASMTRVFATTDAPAFDPAFDSRYATGARIFPDRRAHVDLLLSTRGLGAHTVLRAVPVARRLGLLAS